MYNHENSGRKSRVNATLTFIEAIFNFFRGRHILSTLLFLFPFYFAGFLNILLIGRGENKNVAVMAALAALGGGAILGFLFGIPQALQSKIDGGETSIGEGQSQGQRKMTGAQNPRRFQSNTNLEQVSDWLTKILIGAGLVQIQNLKTGLGPVNTN